VSFCRRIARRERYGLRVSDKRVLRGMFGLNSEELTAGRRTSYSEVLCGLYSSNKGGGVGRRV
jgi:hypothetical protein